MKEKIEQFFLLKKELEIELVEWVKDKSIPLEERWDVFIKSKLGNHSGGLYWNFESLDEELFHSEHGKYETLNVEDVISWFARNNKNKYTETDFNNFKEEALAEFIYSWDLDW